LPKTKKHWHAMNLGIVCEGSTRSVLHGAGKVDASILCRNQPSNFKLFDLNEWAG